MSLFLYLRRALGSLRFCVGGNQKWFLIGLMRFVRIEADAVTIIAGLNPANEANLSGPSAVRTHHIASLPGRSSKRNGPLVLALAGGKA
jgi:hypothetical protein